MQQGTTADEEDLKRRLDALGVAVPVSSKIARLRVLFDNIEGAFRRGATRQDVLDTLNDDGFDMTMVSFKSALQRIRAERRETRGDALPDATLPIDRSTSEKCDGAPAGDGISASSWVDAFTACASSRRRWNGSPTHE